jgi:hypothetical protein
VILLNHLLELSRNPAIGAEPVAWGLDGWIHARATAAAIDLTVTALSNSAPG